ncbi:MAG: hypothetical protein LBN21_09525 [Treponema sp.]|jgi:hypothetical protein|nr:hypothetical protein [Treponema sp.]
MKKTVILLIALMCVITIPFSGVYAQAANPSLPPVELYPEFPRWSRDLRRAEIIAFGSLPFTMFTATTVMDSIRWGENNWDTKYAPWPIKSAGAVSMTNSEQEMTFIIAASASVAVALADFIIISIKRYKSEQRALNIPVGTPIIIRKPYPESDASAKDAAAKDAEDTSAADF